MNFYFRWRLFITIVAVLNYEFGTPAVNAASRFKGLNGKAWANFAANLKQLRMTKDANLIIALLWMTVNASPRDRLDYNLKAVALEAYGIVRESFIAAFPRLSDDDERNLMRSLWMLDSCAKTLGLPKHSHLNLSEN